MMLTIVEYSDEQQTVKEEINIVGKMDATLGCLVFQSNVFIFKKIIIYVYLYVRISISCLECLINISYPWSNDRDTIKKAKKKSGFKLELRRQVVSC